MKHWLFWVVSMLLLFSVSILQSQQTQQSQAQTLAQTQDGVARCHNFVKDGKKPNCNCWGTTDTNNPNYRVCPKPQGEDTKCTNHCKVTFCDCKSRCQS